jgi:hypothetical protein
MSTQLSQIAKKIVAKVIWGAQCGKSARWVLLGETSSRSQARSVRALARKCQITARLRKGLQPQGSSLPSHESSFWKRQPEKTIRSDPRTPLAPPRMPAVGRSSNLVFQPVQNRTTIRVSSGFIPRIPIK